MSRLTGNDALGLFEAYQSVYTPQQELTEEQLWEEVEVWVNSLLEEGYDLSDYTWEEMYENYLSEAGVNFGGNAAVSKVKSDMASQAQSDDKLSALRQQRFGGSKSTSPGSSQYRSSTSVLSAKPPITSGRPESRFAGARDTAIAKARQIQGSPVVGSKPVATTPAATTKPAATPAAKPAATPAAKPAATPAAKPAGSAMDQWAAANPKLAAAKAERDRTRGTSSTTNPLMKDMKSSLPAAKPAATPTTKPAATPAATQKPKPAATSTLTQSFDVFDVVLGHLLDEGYADTEEAAVVIMANMSEEWKSSIIQNIV